MKTRKGFSNDNTLSIMSIKWAQQKISASACTVEVAPKLLLMYNFLTSSLHIFSLLSQNTQILSYEKLRNKCRTLCDVWALDFLVRGYPPPPQVTEQGKKSVSLHWYRMGWQNMYCSTVSLGAAYLTCQRKECLSIINLAGLQSATNLVARAPIFFFSIMRLKYFWSHQCNQL